MVSAAAKRPLGPDPTHYPVDQDVGESILHKLIIELLRPLVERWLAARGTPCFVGADPLADTSTERVRWQLFRHVPSIGFAVVERSDGDRLFSETLDCWLRTVGTSAELRVRLATGPNGDELVPTEAEAERAQKLAERAEKLAERAEKLAERLATEAERAAKDSAQAEVARLRAELERMRRGH